MHRSDQLYSRVALIQLQYNMQQSQNSNCLRPCVLYMNICMYLAFLKRAARSLSETLQEVSLGTIYIHTYAYPFQQNTPIGT